MTPAFVPRSALAAALAALTAGAALTGCGGSGGRAATGVRTIGASARVAPGRNTSFMSAIADARHGRVYATWSRSLGEKTRVYVAASTDGGRTFGAPVWMAHDDGAGMPSLRVDDAGRVYVTWTHFDLAHLLDPKNAYSNPSWQVLARSDDAGRTFTTPVAVTTERRGGSAFGALSVAPDGHTVSAFWLDYLPVFDPRHRAVGRDAARALVATSRDGGRTFAAPVVVDRTSCVCCEPYGYTVDGRTAFALRDWQHGTARADIRDIAVVQDAAAGWTAPQHVHDDHFLLHHCPSVGPAVAVDDHGLEHVAWWTGASGRAGYWYATRRGDGSFSAPVPVERHPVAPNENNATLALDDTGTAWTATVGHGEFDASGNELKAPNAVKVYAIAPDGRVREVPAAEMSGAYPQLATLPGTLVEVWNDGTSLRARRLELDA
ncbi:MAG TPA: sialidase family protein [Solirubrobacteraceae bacterium]|nr:sialidase family protein [Solirubrobacteraceae bacterium]